MNIDLRHGQLDLQLLIEERVAEFAQFWDFARLECLFDHVDDYLAVNYRDEGIMLRFLVALSLMANRYNFFLIDAMLEIGKMYLNVAQDWVPGSWWT